MDTVTTLLSARGAPPLIHFHHPHSPPSALSFDLPPRCKVARLDAVEHHTARLLYAGILSRLATALHRESELGVRQPGDDGREVITWDAFARSLRALWEHYAAAKRAGEEKGKGKTNRRQDDEEEYHENDDEDNGQVVIVITKAERLKGVMGASWAALTRLPELAGIPATLVFCSQMPWDDLRPARGDAPEPVHVYLEPLQRDEILALLGPGSQHPLYKHFLDLLLATIGHLAPSSPPSEIEYVGSALWPIYTAALPAHEEMVLLGREYPDPDSPPPPLTVSVRLLTDLKHQLSLALAAATESVLPRAAGHAEFTRALLPTGPDGSLRPASARVVPRPPPLDLPLAAKFLLVAAYCASYNPAKSDVRLFGRGTGPDGKRRRGGGAARRAGYGKTRLGKVPQRLLGPRPFPLDRLLAMFAALYAENAPRPADLELPEEEQERYDPFASPAVAAMRATQRREEEIAREEAWEDEVDQLAFSAKLWALIPELEAQGLLRRASPVDRLDNVMFRCEVDYETVKSVAKELKLVLDEYLYEATV